MSGDRYLFYAALITDENREQLKWLAAAIALEGRACVSCGYTWTNRETVIANEPYTAGDGDFICKACYDAGKLPPE